MRMLEYTRSNKIAAKIERAVRLIDKGVTLVPLKRGEWEEYSGCGHNDRRCSNCHDYYTDEPNNLRFCPRCGAKMKKYVRLNLSRPPEERFPWLYPNSKDGRKWHPAAEQLPNRSGEYWAILESKSIDISVKDYIAFNHEEKTWTFSPENRGRGHVVKYWKEDE